jgi:DNA invertase Pin-like site-specific DNA recombinase
MVVQKIKRVVTLLRVSTERQDTEMQRDDCMAYIKTRTDWEFKREYEEPGVSAYKTAVADRDILQEVIRDAKSGEFDVLLVFLQDRICRITEDYMPTLKRLSKYVEVWTAKGRDLTIRNHTDVLMASIDGWQNEGESKKISERTDTIQKQMTQAGIPRGGGVPYGYKYVLAGRYAVKDVDKRKELYDLAINDEEAEVVRLMFKWVIDHGWGGNLIAQELNKLKKPTRGGVNGWQQSTINYMLARPEYKGYMAYGRHSQKDGNSKRQPKETWTLSDEANRKNLGECATHTCGTQTL